MFSVIVFCCVPFVFLRFFRRPVRGTRLYWQMNRIWWPVAVLAAIIAFIGNVIQGNYFSICIDAWILHDLWRDRPDDWDKPFRKAGRWLMHGLQPPATQTA